MSVRIDTDRFVMRELSERDVTQRYLDWFSDSETKTYISSAPTTKNLVDLRRYVAERMGRADVLFLGIFDKASGLHIGNVKYEPVDATLRYAVMGILVGDAAFRGKSVAAEVLRASGLWLKEHRNIDQIVLGVDRDNTGAIRAYEKVGFVVETTPFIATTAVTTTMVWRLPGAHTSR
jgi:ribosomal-protein-alanine N-acetyltransferase